MLSGWSWCRDAEGPEPALKVWRNIAPSNSASPPPTRIDTNHQLIMCIEVFVGILISLWTAFFAITDACTSKRAGGPRANALDGVLARQRRHLSMSSNCPYGSSYLNNGFWVLYTL